MLPGLLLSRHFSIGEQRTILIFVCPGSRLGAAEKANMSSPSGILALEDRFPSLTYTSQFWHFV
jgi:hypothetical protein